MIDRAVRNSFAQLLLIAGLTPASAYGASPCDSSDQAPPGLAAAECAVISAPRGAARQVVYQDAERQYLVEMHDLLRTLSGLEVTVIATDRLPSSLAQARATDGLSSTRRRIAIACSTRRVSQLAEWTYGQPLARGEPLTARLTPEATMRPVTARWATTPAATRPAAPPAR